MSNHNPLNYQLAVADFNRARKQAAIRWLLARLTGKPTGLMAYDDVGDQLESAEIVEKGLQEIPLDAIVGSVGRYKDFTRDFLPRNPNDEERWANVRAAVLDMRRMPPIEVYKVGDVYFVKDGNHRVSVSRQMGSSHISAYVTEVKTRLPLSPQDDPDEIICKARYANFLQRTNLDKLRPGADLLMTFCGQYGSLLEQIAAHREAMAADGGHPVSYEDAVADWYDTVYGPVVALIHERGLLRQFPERTETDLYVLLVERQAEIKEALGWDVDRMTAVVGWSEEARVQSRPAMARLIDAVVPLGLGQEPPSGDWRESQLAAGRQNRLFADYLIAFEGVEADWAMLEQVIPMAKWDHDRLLGLHVVPSKEQIDSPEIQAMKQRYDERCREAGLEGSLAVVAGNVVEQIVHHAAWADLVVLSLRHPPGDRPLGRLGSRVTHLIQRCPRPILTIPSGQHSPMNRILLAYDGSRKADEALFVATYLAGRWPVSLVVLTVETDYTPASALEVAREYIESRGIEAVEFVLRAKPIAKAMLKTAAEYECNYLIMGGFGFQPVKHFMLGSSVDIMLRRFKHPILICR